MAVVLLHLVQSGNELGIDLCEFRGPSRRLFRLPRSWLRVTTAWACAAALVAANDALIWIVRSIGYAVVNVVLAWFILHRNSRWP